MLSIIVGILSIALGTVWLYVGEGSIPSVCMGSLFIGGGVACVENGIKRILGGRMTYWNTKKSAYHIKYCPHCNGTSRVRKDILGFYFVQCERCGCRTRGTQTEEESVREWNRRGGRD